MYILAHFSERMVLVAGDFDAAVQGKRGSALRGTGHFGTRTELCLSTHTGVVVSAGCAGYFNSAAEAIAKESEKKTEVRGALFAC